jgi:ATP-dependent helicase Lhr and Lhr-like helicase
MLGSFHPLVSDWFSRRFGTPTEPQERGWPLIRAGDDVLIAAPTGSGKTLAAFLSCLDDLLRKGLTGTLAPEVQVLYVSPLKALGNDVRKNLEEPLAELRSEAEARGLVPPALRTAVRTGDTPAKERAAVLRKPPHVLITTPESLYVLLTSAGGRALLKPVRTVIVDEIHAVARDKRGAHLALSLERLDALCEARPQRIGLSATQRPIEEIARFLVGSARVDAAGRPRCSIVDLGHRRALDLGIEIPRDEIAAVPSKEQWADVLDQVAALVRAHKSTLVFVNTRKQSERVCRALEERLGEGQVAAHHGSLSREIRLRAEEGLKQGALRAVVATASLELGIDVGHVDLVVQLESPRAFAVALQRVGRAGHTRAGLPKGRLFPLSRDQLVECAALVRGMHAGLLEETRLPQAPLDVLAQQIVAACATEEWDETALYELVRRAWPYRGLTREGFDRVVRMHVDGAPRRSLRDNGARLHRDGVNGRIRSRRGARIAALTSGGAIPDTGQYAVLAEPEGLVVGSLDEDFAIESMAGDIFLLGNESWRIRRVELGRIRVENAHGEAPNVPFWRGEAPGRSGELSAAVGALRAEIEALLDGGLGESAATEGNATEGSGTGSLARKAAAASLLQRECGLPAAGAEQLVAYLAAGKAALGAIPTQDTLIAERFFDEAGGMQLIVHAPFGARLNRAFGLALRKRFCRTFDFELQAAASDDAILLSLGPQHSFPLESIFDFLSPRTVEEALTQAVLRAPMFQVRFRWSATRSLAVLRWRNGKKTPLQIVRMRVDDLLAAVFPAQAQCQEHDTGPIEPPDHPLVEESLRDCLHEAMDLPGLTALLGRLERRELRLIARDTAAPSPFAHEILGSAPYTYLDDAPLEERRARMVQTRRTLDPEDAAALGALDIDAIAQVAAQAWPDVRDATELHDLLLVLGILPAADADPAWRSWMDDLASQGRATRLAGRGDWVAAERVPRVRGALLELGEGAVRFDPPLASAVARAAPEDPELATREILRGFLCCTGPASADALALRLGLSRAAVAIGLAQLEGEGVVLQGRYSPGAQTTEWCERTLLARIHRATLGRLRREIEPSSAADFLRFLTRWQHVLPGTQLHGARGLAEVIGQLQGFQVAAAAWESDALPLRIARYEPGMLDQLCLSGEVAWGRLALPRLPGEAGEGDRARPPPTRATPLSLVRREDLPWLLDAFAPSAQEPAEEPQLGAHARRALALLQQRGALFSHELRAGAGLRPTELSDALWELVAAGLAACDGFGAVRNLVSPARGVSHLMAAGSPGHGSHASGRWSLLRPFPTSETGGAGEREPFTDAPEAVSRLARQYLRRYGIVFRDLLAREPRCPPFRELLRIYRRLEARGELRGGRFVNGFSGEQFALPEALDALRSVRRAPRTGEERVLLSAVDPLNLAGILTPGPRIPAQAGNRLLLVDGVPQPLTQGDARTA